MTRVIGGLLLAAALLTTGVGAQEPSRRLSQASAVAPVDLNTASAMQLEALPGIGSKTAQRIVEYRNKNGEFKKVEHLMNVRGVGEKSFLKLKSMVTVTPPKTDRAKRP